MIDNHALSWRPIETAPRDGTVIDLWMVDQDGKGYREANAYWVTDRGEEIGSYENGQIVIKTIRRDGWFGENHDYEGADGWADQPKRLGGRPERETWILPTHWMPLPPPPTPEAQS